MSDDLRPIKPGDVEHCADFGLEAFRPIFEGWEQDYGKALLDALRPDWEQAQVDLIRDWCSSEEKETWVAAVDDRPVGFVVLSADEDAGLGRIDLLAVDPTHQGRGIGTALNERAVERLRAMGAAFIVVGTGSDAGHAAARSAYEKAGFTPLPIHPIHYVLRLDES
jgi:ribosomal protein S18 acetylase RimI-like enzyme